METTTRRPRRHVQLLYAGCGLLLVCVALYGSGVSRAVGAWLLPLAGAFTAVGGAGVAGRRVPRWAYWALALAVSALVAMGAWTFGYALSRPPRLD